MGSNVRQCSRPGRSPLPTPPPVWLRLALIVLGWALLLFVYCIHIPDAHAEWSPTLKAEYGEQLDAVVSGATAVNNVLRWASVRPAAMPQVYTFVMYTVDALTAHLYALKHVADIPGEPSGPGERPVYGCINASGIKIQPCDKDMEPPYPPRADVLARARTLMQEAVSKYASADAALAVLERTYGLPSLALTRTPFVSARTSAQTFPWTLPWHTEPRPVDGVLDAPGYTRDHAPAYYPQGSWSNVGNGIAKSLYWYWQSWKTMVFAAAYHCPTCVRNGAFAQRHVQGSKSGVAALGLLVGVETFHVKPHLDWIMDPPNFPRITTTRQQQRIMLIAELLGNIDPGGTLVHPSHPSYGQGSSARGFNYDERPLVETTTMQYTDTVICTGLIQGLREHLGTTQPYVTWSLEALRQVCDAHYHQGNTLYRLFRAQYYAPLPWGE